MVHLGSSSLILSFLVIVDVPFIYSLNNTHTICISIYMKNYLKHNFWNLLPGKEIWNSVHTAWVFIPQANSCCLVYPLPAGTHVMQSDQSCQTPFDPSCSQSLPVRISSSLHVTLPLLCLVNVILWPEPPRAFSTYLWLHISPGNCWVTERQYWPLHYRTARQTGHRPLGSRSLCPDWPYLPRSSGVIYPEFIRTLLELPWVPYSKVAWPRWTVSIRYWLQFVYFSRGWTNLPTLGSRGQRLECKVKYWK